MLRRAHTPHKKYMILRLQPTLTVSTRNRFQAAKFCFQATFSRYAPFKQQQQQPTTFASSNHSRPHPYFKLTASAPSPSFLRRKAKHSRRARAVILHKENGTEGLL
jgi:hypothetical protein